MIGLLKKGGSNNGGESTANDDDFDEDDNLNFIESLLTWMKQKNLTQTNALLVT